MTSIGSFDYFGDLIQNTVNNEQEQREEDSDENNLSEGSLCTQEVAENSPTKVCKPYIKQTLLTPNEDGFVPMTATTSNAKTESKSAKKATSKKTNEAKKEGEGQVIPLTTRQQEKEIMMR